MYCWNCGEKIKDGVKYCVNCGNEIIINRTNNTKVSENNKSITGFILSIIGFLTCGICSIIGLIFSIQGLSESKKKGKQDTIAILGIIISSIPLLVILLGICLVVTAKKIEVIDFSSKTIEEAQQWCDKEGASCNITEDYSDTITSKSLISQSEKPGSKVTEYTVINIKYSKGKELKKEKTTEQKKKSTKQKINSNTKQKEDTTKQKSDNTPIQEETPDEYKASCQYYDYKEIARQPDAYKNSRAHFSGKVLQVTEHTFDSNKIDLRVDVTEDEYGLWDDTIYVTYKYKTGEKKY